LNTISYLIHPGSVTYLALTHEPALTSTVIDDQFPEDGYRFRLEKDSWILVEISRASPSNTKFILTLMKLFYGKLHEGTMSKEGDSCLYSSDPMM
jgi:hypothetical protein